MKSKAFVPPAGFYIVDAEICSVCNKTKLIYNGCRCHTEGAKCARLEDKLQAYRDTLIATLAHVNEKDIYLQGLCRGQITAYEKAIELMKELEK